MRLFGTVDILKFDAAAYTKTVKMQLERHFRLAAKAFLREAALSGRVPVQTGMARGSFLNLGRLLNTLVPISPTRFNERYRHPGSSSTIPKVPNAGASLSTRKDKIITWKGNRIRFEFSSRVFHLTLEDEIGVRSGPWGAFRAGRAAFIAELRSLRKRLPKIKSFIIRTTLSFGRNSGIERQEPLLEQDRERIS